MSYDAFISYSHGEDSALAEAVQGGLQRFARPWYRRRALHVFRDSTGLSANPGLWSSIVDVMADSNYLIVLCSPDAAESPWVGREIEHWRETKPADHIIPVLTAGELVWDDTAGDFDVARSTALNPALAGAFTEEPLYVDMRWAHSSDQLTARDPRFSNRIADIAAPLHGVAKDDIVGEDIRQHRRALRLAWGAAIALVLLSIGTVAAAGVAKRNADERAKLTVSLSSAKKDLEDTRAKVRGANDDLKTAQDHLKATQDQLKSTASKLTSTEGQLGSTQGQLTSTNGTLQSTLGTLDRTNATLAGTKRDLSSTKHTLDVQNAVIGQKNALIDQGNTKIDEQSQTLTQLSGQERAAAAAARAAVAAARAAVIAEAQAKNAENVAVAHAGAVGLAAASQDGPNVASHLDLSLLLADAATKVTAVQSPVPAAASAVSVSDAAAYDALLRANVESGRIRGFLQFTDRQGPQALGKVTVSPDGKYVAAVETSDVIAVGEVQDTTRIYVWRTDDLSTARAMQVPATFDCVSDLRWSASDDLYTVEARRDPDASEPSCLGAVLYKEEIQGVDISWGASRVREWTVDGAGVHPSSLPFELDGFDGISLETQSPLAVSKDGRYVAISFDTRAPGVDPPFILPATLIRDTLGNHDDLVVSDIGGITGLGPSFDATGTKLLGLDELRGPAVYDLTQWTSDVPFCMSPFDFLTGCFKEVNPTFDSQLDLNLQLTPDASTFALTARIGAATTSTRIEFFDAVTGASRGDLTRSVPAGVFGYSLGDHLLAVTDLNQHISLTRWDDPTSASTPVDINPSPGCTYGVDIADDQALLLVHRICTGDVTGSTLVVDTTNGHVLRELQGETTFADALGHVVTEQLDLTQQSPHQGFELWDFGVGDGTGTLIASQTDRSAVISPDGQTLVSYRPHFPTSPEADAEVWHLDSRETAPETLASSTGTRAVGFVDGHTVVGVGTMGAGVIWDLDATMEHTLFDDFHDGDPSNDPQPCVGPDNTIASDVDWLLRSALSPDGTVRAVARDARTIQLVSLDSKPTTTVPQLPLGTGERISDMRFTHDEDSLSLFVDVELVPTPEPGQLVCAFGDPIATIVVRLRDGGAWLSHPTATRFDNVEAVQSSRDGRRLLFASLSPNHTPGTHVIVRDGTTLALVNQFDTTALPLDGALGSPGNLYAIDTTGTRVAGTNAQGYAVIWSVATGSVVADLAPPTKIEPTASLNLAGISFSPDGRSLAVKTVDQRLLEWNISNPAAATVLPAQLGSDAAARVVYSPDGSLIAVDAMLFDAKTLQPIGPRLLPADWDNPLVDVGTQMSQFVQLDDGTLLFELVRTGGASAVSWAIDTASLQDRACAVAGRNLTREEFGQYGVSGEYRATPCEALPEETRIR